MALTSTFHTSNFELSIELLVLILTSLSVKQ
jgi:hypothetical protein